MWRHLLHLPRHQENIAENYHVHWWRHTICSVSLVLGSFMSKRHNFMCNLIFWCTFTLVFQRRGALFPYVAASSGLRCEAFASRDIVEVNIYFNVHTIYYTKIRYIHKDMSYGWQQKQGLLQRLFIVKRDFW